MHALAKKALKRDTGARALRSITEELMVDLMYQLPEEPKPAKYVITKDVVEGKANLFDRIKIPKKNLHRGIIRVENQAPRNRTITLSEEEKSFSTQMI